MSDLLAIISVVNAIALTIFTAVYAGLTAWMAKTARATAEASHQAAEASRQIVAEAQAQQRATIRPYVVIEDAQFKWYGDGIVAMDFDVLNAGAGSAIELGLAIALVSATPLEDKASVIKASASFLPLLPGTKVRIAVKGLGLNVGHRRSDCVLESEVSCRDVSGYKYVQYQCVKVLPGRVNYQELGGPSPTRLSARFLDEFARNTKEVVTPNPINSGR